MSAALALAPADAPPVVSPGSSAAEARRVLPLGGARGLDLIELAAHRLGLSRWKAAVALARMCGLSAVPEVPAR